MVCSKYQTSYADLTTCNVCPISRKHHTDLSYECEPLVFNSQSCYSSCMFHKNLWAPWRMAYMRQIAAEMDDVSAEKMASADKSTGCFLCDAFQTDMSTETAQMRGVLHVAKYNVMLLNRYPYTNGHLLIAPSVHVGSLSDLASACRAEMMELAEVSERLLREAMHCQGVNVGMNLGRCAGAGVPGHVHMHVLPRWEGDTNFMQTIGGVRVQPQALDASYAHLRAALEKLIG